MKLLLDLAIAGYLLTGLVFAVFYLVAVLNDPEEKWEWGTHLLAAFLVITVLPAIFFADFVRQIWEERRSGKK